MFLGQGYRHTIIITALHTTMHIRGVAPWSERNNLNWDVGLLPSTYNPLIYSSLASESLLLTIYHTLRLWTTNIAHSINNHHYLLTCPHHLVRKVLALYTDHHHWIVAEMFGLLTKSNSPIQLSWCSSKDFVILWFDTICMCRICRHVLLCD